MKQDELKRNAAMAALDYIEPGMVVGVGTGSTVNYFIEGLAKRKADIEATVTTSHMSEQLLKQHGLPVLDLNTVDSVPIYVDGADEVNHHLQLIKGGGGALTREKIVASVAKQFVCVADASKRVMQLGKFPLPVEVIPMARSYVARELVKLGGDPMYREGVLTDNGNIILDVHNLSIMEPIQMERSINDIAGVVCNGIFALRPADVLLLAGENEVQTIRVS